MINLLNPDDRKALEEKIKDDINSWCEEKYFTGHRDHLGASIMGHAAKTNGFAVKTYCQDGVLHVWKEAKPS